ncbi:glycosyltransferase [Amycolatopsis sp. FU40]|uniref:glycosyltransferase n=1 Tax=Amycolatopsis sp. FU40 TaxID=2914159 RepID=UPI001F2C6282|nr:glycosyltransferase [Amycolatopsis sp. FU40]UKD58062.1 glycosyltransferase [Amycolatopsis sp. FU40]
MRLLVTACPAASHFRPLVPFARAARAAGHDVLVAIGGGYAAQASACGLPVHPVGGDVSLLSVPGGPGRSGWARMLELAERTAPDLLALARTWRPDAVVRTPPEFAGALAARAIGARLLEHSFGLVMPRARLLAAERELAALSEIHGVRPRLPEPDALIDLCPPSARPARLPAGIPLRFQPCRGEPAAGPREADLCLTLGTILPRLGRTEVVPPVLAAARDLGLRTVVLGMAVPGTLSLEWAPLDTVRCRVLAHHGGSGTTFSALAAGVPQLVMPHLTDQPDNAALVESAGAGMVLEPSRVTRTSAREALARLLSPGAAAAAGRLRAEISAMPSPADVVRDLLG